MRIHGLMLAGLFIGLACAAPSALRAEEKASEAPAVVKVTGYLTKFEIAKDGKSAVAFLLVKGKKVEIQIQDSLTIRKLKIGKIIEDDEIKASYKNVDGKNVSVTFVRTAGC